MFASLFFNLDFITVGVAIASSLILGFMVFFQNPRSATAILFILQTAILSIWSLMNYLSYIIINLDLVLLTQRLVMFFAIPNSVIFMLLMYTFPNSRLNIQKKVLFGLVVISLIVMGITLSPFLFTGVGIVPGVVAHQPVVGPGMIAFIPIAILSVFIGIYFLVKRYLKSSGIERLQLRFLLFGVVIMFTLILTLDFIFPAFLNNTRFIPLSAVFTFPFIAFTAYAIFKHHLLNIKVITTEIAAFLLAIVTLFDVVLSKDVGTLIFKSGTFALVLAFGIILIKSVLKEVEQREELERLNTILSEEKAKVEELSRFKTQLLSLASHQVKAPLSAIKGFVSLILDGTYGVITDATKETLGKVKRSADGLVELINTLLDVRKVEEGKMEYQFSETDIVKIVNDTVEELRPLAVNKKLELNFTPPQGQILVTADGQKLKQVIQNLIDNAIKYTPTPVAEGQTGFVNVALREEQSKEMPNKTIVVFSVQDSGFGIKPQLMPYLFEEFVRDEAVKREIRGTGLGLYIARKIVEAHGGRIWAESKGDGQGSTFYVELRRV